MDIKKQTDEVFLRFPHLSEAIFYELDNKSLTNCREVNDTWKNIIDHEKLTWLRRIQKYRERFEPFLEQWNEVIKKTPIEEIKELCLSVEQLFKLGSNIMRNQYTPLHCTAEIGLIRQSKRIIEITDYRRNNSYLPNLTPLHLAAENGHFDVCKLILENVVSKNPVAFNGLTPLHSAAKGGHLDIIKLLIDNGVDRRPLFHGRTPLQEAATNGHMFCCKFLIDNLQDLQQFFGCFLFQDGPDRVHIPLVFAP